MKTRLTELFDIEYPIVSAPMSGHSGGDLAGAVSAGGGLGAFGAVYTGDTTGYLNDNIARARAASNRACSNVWQVLFSSVSTTTCEIVLDKITCCRVSSHRRNDQWVRRICTVPAARRVESSVQECQRALWLH